MTTLAAFVAVPVLGGAVSGLLSDFRGAAYRKPAWQPPAWVFGPVWTALYAAMGVASWLLYKAPPSAARTAALALYAGQLALNLAWSPLFTSGRVRAALALILALDAAVAALIVAAARVRPLAAWLLAPYAAWLALATALTFAISKNT